MVMAAVVAFFHFAGVFGLLGALVVQWATLTPSPSRVQALRIRAADTVLAISALLVLTAGLARVAWFEKGSAYYETNGFFKLKFSLFVIGGLLSIYPTRRFAAWRGVLALGGSPVMSAREYHVLRRCVMAQLIAVMAIALCASLMAHGVGA